MTISATFSPPDATESLRPGANGSESNQEAMNLVDMTTTATQHGKRPAMVLRKLVRIEPALRNGCAARMVKCPQDALEIVRPRRSVAVQPRPAAARAPP